MIENKTLAYYADRLTYDQRRALASDALPWSRYGIAYNGPNLEVDPPYADIVAGMPRLRPQHFHCGGFLTPIGKRLADIVNGETGDDDYRL